MIALAYTLQTGRQAMAERLALVASSLDEVKDKLTQYAQGQVNEREDFYQSNVKNRLTQSELLLEGGAESIKSIIKERKLNKLAQLWCSGIEIDWPLLYSNHKPQRISLPTYPFAKERHWIEPTKTRINSDESVQVLRQPTKTREEMAVTSAISDSPINTSLLLEKVQQDLLIAISTILKVSEDEIGLEDNTRHYGADSITITLFANQLNEIYKLDIKPTALFKYASIASLAQFLCAKYQDRLYEYYQASSEVAITIIPEESHKEINTSYPLSYQRINV